MRLCSVPSPTNTRGRRAKPALKAWWEIAAEYSADEYYDPDGGDFDPLGGYGDAEKEAREPDEN